MSTMTVEVEINLSKVSSADLIEEIKARGEWPKETKIGDFDLSDLKTEVAYRGHSVIEQDDDLQDEVCLGKAIDYARWGNRDQALYYLTQAIPALHPIEKLVAA